MTVPETKMSKNAMRTGVASIVLLTAACGGGGGGGGDGVAAPPVSGFPGFSNVAPDQSYLLDGLTLTGQMDYDDATNAASIRSLSGPHNETAEFGFDGARELASLDIYSAEAPISVDVAAGAIKREPVPFQTFEKNGGNNEVRIFSVNQYEHMTFGWWANNLRSGPTNFGVGVFGDVSSPTNLRGQAIYDGFTTGMYVDPRNELFQTISTFTADVDFGTREYVMISRQSEKVAPGIAQAPDPFLDFTARGSIDNGQIRAGATSSSGMMTGSVAGTFFGPTGEEVGGVFELDGSTGRYVGAFGGQRR